MVTRQNRVPARLSGQRLASSDSSPAASAKPARKEKSDADETAKACGPKGVILVSEAFTEINAGLVIVLASSHESPVSVTALEDPDTDPDGIATTLTRAYHEHVEAHLALRIRLRILSTQWLEAYWGPRCSAPPLASRQIGAMRGVCLARGQD